MREFPPANQVNQNSQYIYIFFQFQEQALLNKTVEELYVFREFIEEMRAHESQNQSSLFTAKFQAIENEIDYLNNLIQNVVSKGQIIIKN